MDMASEKQRNLIEQFVILAKSAKGQAMVALVNQVLETPGLYVFGELLDMPNVKELQKNPAEEKHYKLLNIFAYGTYTEYQEQKDTLPPLNQQQEKKLKHLTIVSLATKNKCIPYDVLLKELEIKNLRALEDLIIEVMYADIIRGKLDQKTSQLEVDYVIGRDVKPSDVDEIESVLQDWCSRCEVVLANIDAQVTRANNTKESNNKAVQKMETEIANIKKTIKASQPSADMEESMVTDSRVGDRDLATSSDKPSKKGSKSKGLRGSGKFWGKSS